MRKLLAASCALMAALAICAPGAGAQNQPQRQPVEVAYGFYPPAYALDQQRLMSKTLDGVAAQRPGVRDVYILSVGLHGGHVFESEATEGAQALEAHFNAAGRSIVLSNDHHAGPATLANASPEHIQAALGRLGEVMDKSEDVAVIFLTSHGAHNAGIAGQESVVSGGETGLRDFMISPGMLRGALDASGIKNRIIILSSCFSGQFIPTLQDPNTIVLTAASAEKTSFGCQAEREWTYFGDAFFAKSLPQANGLMDAFAKAKTVISGWETEGSLTPSEPQSFVGAQTKFLAEIEKKK